MYEKKMYYALLMARFLLGGIFIYASIHKIVDPHSFAESIFRYQILPECLINFTAVVLPVVEVLAGVLLIAGVWVPGSTLVITAMLASFFMALVYNISRGLDISCGCFSTSSEVVSQGQTMWYLVRDISLLSTALFLLGGIFRGSDR